MKLSRPSLRFPLGLLVGVALLIGCQLGSDPDPVVETTITANGSVGFSDTLRLPDFGVWRTNNVSRPADTGRGSVTCVTSATSGKKECRQNFALKAVLGSDLLVQDLYTLGVHFATFKYSQTGTVPQLNLLGDSIRLFAMEDTLIREFNRQYKGDKKPTAADLTAYYAKLLVDADPSVKDSALPRGMVADTVKKILVQVAAQQGITAKVLVAKSLLGLTAESVRTITDVLVKAGVKIDTTKLYPAAPVREVESLKVLSDVTEGEEGVAVSGAFTWETAAVVRKAEVKVLTSAGVVDTNVRANYEKLFDPTTGSWVLTNNMTLKARRGATIGTDTLIVTILGDSGFATSKTAFKVLRGDTTPPKLTITEPAPGTEVPNTTEKIKVTVDATDTKGIAEVKVGTTVVTASPYSTEVDLAVGYNIIAVQVKDNSGLVSTDQVIVRRLASTTSSDATAPVVTWRSPTGNTTVATGLPSIELSWTASDNVGVKKVTLNGTEISGTAGVYTKSAPLHDGDNVFEIKAFDDVGNTDTDSLIITRPADQSKPGITPPSDQTVGADISTLKLTWKITNSHKATKITLNGTEVTLGAEVTSEVTLKPGVNSFNLVVTDLSGATVSETVVITRKVDVVIVLPAITTLADKAVGVDIDTATLTWAITNSDKAKSATLNGDPIAVGASITKLVKLDPGPNLFKLVLKDSSGTEVSSSTTILRAIDTALLGVSKLADRSVSPETETDSLTWTILNPSKAVSATLNDKPVTPGATIGARVTLAAGNNQYILTLTDAKGKPVADTVIVARAADATGPSLTWVAPTTKTHSVEAATTSYVVQVKVTDPSGVDSVYLNGVPTKKETGDLYSVTLALPKPDGNPITVTVVAKDAKGNASKDSVTVARKVPDGTNKPIIKLLKPAKATENALPFDSTTIRIEADITDALLAIDPKTVTIGGVAATAPATGSVYAADVPVPPSGAPYTITIKAANANAIASTLDVVVTRAKDAIKPVITPDATTKTQSVDFGTTSLALSWAVSDNHKLATILYQGLSIPVTATVKQTLTLSVGANPVKLVAIDSTGNQDSVELVITRKQDATPPVVTITKPAATSTVAYGTTSVDVTASATDAGTGIKSLTIGGKAAPLAGGTVSVTLGASKNVIKVVAIDNAGNTATDSVVVTLAADEVGPDLKITSPLDKSEIPYPGTTVTVVAEASDALSGLASIKIGTTTCTKSPCSAANVAPDASGKITVVATDNAGKTTTKSISVTIGSDKTAPVIKPGTGAVASMVENGITSQVVAWTVTDNGSLGAVAITNNGGMALPTTGTYSSTVSLAEGENKIVITAKDAAGNSATPLTFTITRKYKVATPTFLTAAGEVLSGASIKLNCATPFATIKYVLSSGTTEYTYDGSKGIVITDDVTITAWAILTNNTTSDKTTPTKYTVKRDVSLKSVTAGVKSNTQAAIISGATVTLAPLTTFTNTFSVTVTATAAAGADVSINGGSSSESVTLVNGVAAVKIAVTNGSAFQEYSVKLQLATKGTMVNGGAYYSVAKIGSKWWTTEPTGGSAAAYYWSQATASYVCPTGWSLPKRDDVLALDNPVELPHYGLFWTSERTAEDPAVSHVFGLLYKQTGGNGEMTMIVMDDVLCNGDNVDGCTAQVLCTK